MRHVLTTAIIGLGLAGCQAERPESTLQDSLDPRTNATEVTLQGPHTVKAKPYYFSKRDGKSFTIEINKGTIRDCFPSIGYRVSKLNDGKYLVEQEPLMVPAVVCTENMMRDIEVGTEIEIPASEYSWNSAQIMITDRAFGALRTKVNVKAEGEEVKVLDQDTIALDFYSYFGRTNDPFTLEIDHHDEYNCGPTVGYSTTKLTDGHFVDIQLRPQRAFCPPNMRLKRHVGETIRVEKNTDGYQWGRLIVSSHPLHEGEPAKVEIKKDDGEVYVCNVISSNML